MQPNKSRWVGRFFLAAVALVGIHIKRIKISPHTRCPPHGNNSTLVLFFKLFLFSFSPSITMHHCSVWFRISCVSFLSCSPNKTSFSSAHTLTKMLFTARQYFSHFAFIVLFLCWIFNTDVPNNKLWFEHLLSEGSTLQSACVFILLPSLLQTLRTKVSLSVLLHVQLVTCQNRRVRMKSVTVVNIYGISYN